jgi:hypothetical protein
MAAALMLGFTESTDFPSFLDIIQSSFLDAFSTRPSRQQLIFEIATMTFFFFLAAVRVARCLYIGTYSGSPCGYVVFFSPNDHSSLTYPTHLIHAVF